MKSRQKLSTPILVEETTAFSAKTCIFTMDNDCLEIFYD